MFFKKKHRIKFEELFLDTFYNNENIYRRNNFLFDDKISTIF